MTGRFSSGTVVGFGEILLRLISEGKVIPPTQFIPLLESLYACRRWTCMCSARSAPA